MKIELGDWWDDFVKETEEIEKRNEKRQKEAEEKYRKHLEEQEAERLKRLDDLQKNYNFTVTEDLVPALERLERLAVNKYRLDDYFCQDSFKHLC